jgi:hypothetical protein
MATHKLGSTRRTIKLTALLQTPVPQTSGKQLLKGGTCSLTDDRIEPAPQFLRQFCGFVAVYCRPPHFALIEPWRSQRAATFGNLASHCALTKARSCRSNGATDK